MTVTPASYGRRMADQPINGSDGATRVRPALPQFTNAHLTEGRPFADKICEAAVGLSAQAAVAGAALGLAMLARVAEVTPYQAWKLFDMWMRIVSDTPKPMAAPRPSLLADRTMVDELEDRLRHLIVSCMHGFDLNAEDVRAAVRGLAETELDRIRRAKTIAAPAVGPT